MQNTEHAATVTADIHVRGVNADTWSWFRTSATANGVPVGDMLTTAMLNYLHAHPDTPESRNSLRFSGHEKLGLNPQVDSDGNTRAECPDCHRRIWIAKSGRMGQRGRSSALRRGPEKSRRARLTQLSAS